MKVLITEDTRSTCLFIAAIVQRDGHQAITVSSGEEAVEAFARERPDLVLMDVTLPGIDGYEATRRIRALRGIGWTPLIFLSASQQSADIARGIEAGGDDYLTKPIDAVILGSKIRAMQRIAAMRQELISVSEQLQSSNAELARVANIDGLTGIANRRYVDLSIANAMAARAATGQPLSLILADVDYFKRYNDHFGHQMGDDCLRNVAATISGSLTRRSDVAGRYGGEEFVVLLPNTSGEEASAVAETIRHSVSRLSIAHPGSERHQHVTLSLGVASTTFAALANASAQALIEAADQALYRAKESGRNRVGRATDVLHPQPH